MTTDLNNRDSKLERAQEAFENYDFGVFNIEDQEGWDTSDPLDYIRVAYAVSREDEMCSYKVSFHVRFNAQGSVVEAYGLECRTGNYIGHDPIVRVMTFNGGRSAPTSLNELNMTDVEIMTTAYLEAVYFTETGDADQPPPDSKLTPFFRCQAFIDCRNFLWAIQDLLKNSDLSPRQLGHDLWLTRNGHGSGFWCRTEVYGEDNAKLFTRLACAVGEHHVNFQENDEAPQ